MAILKLDSGDSNTTIKALALEGTSYVGSLVSGAATERLRNILFKRCWLYNDSVAGDVSKWLFLAYNLDHCTFEDMTFGPPDNPARAGLEGAWAEHNGYLHNILGDLTIRRCRGRRAGAQNWQVTNRWGESWEYKHGILTGTEWEDNVGTHLIEFGDTIECGLPRGSGRASFALSFFGLQRGVSQANWGNREPWHSDVIIRGHTIYHTTRGVPPLPTGKPWKLNGAILVEWRPQCILEGVDCEYDGAADQDLVHLHENETVIVRAGPYMRTDGTLDTRKCSFRGQQPFRINGTLSGRTKLIDIEPNDSTVDLIVDGKRIGPLSAGYKWAA